MEMMDFPKAYLYRRIVMAKQFIDSHYSEEIDLRDIAREARFSRFHWGKRERGNERCQVCEIFILLV